MSRFGFGFQSAPKVNLIDIIDDLNVKANLRLCLDAHDGQSYSGSGQVWLDRSGGGYDFFRGANNTATTDDPTFNGTANSPDAYWSFDGGDFFRYDSANESWMNGLHKANAKATWCAWYYPIAGVNNMVAGTLGNLGGSAIGIWFGSGADNNPSLRVGSGTLQPGTYTNPGTIVSAQWQFIAVSYDTTIGPNGAIAQLNGAQTLVNSSYTSTPSAADATTTLEIGSRGNGPSQSPLPNGSRLACVAAWDRALSQAELLAIFNATRGIFGV